MTKTSTFCNHFSGIQNSVIIIFNIYWIGFTCITWARVGKKRVHKAFSTSVTCSHHLDCNGQPWRRCSQTLALARTASPESIFFSFYLSYISSEISLITFWLNLFLLGRQLGPLLVVRHSAEWDSSHCHHGVQSMNTPKFTPAPHWRHRWPI